MAENKTAFHLSNPLKKGANHKSNFRKENELIKELKASEIIKDFVLGAKYCLPTNKLNYDQINQIKSLFGEGEEANRLYRSMSMSDSGWLAVSISSDKADKIKPALEKYREFANNDKDLFISGYGEVEFTIDFSKLGMYQDSDGGVYYPYGAFFFSDNKTTVNQFAAAVACYPDRYQRIKNKRYISPISNENWTNAKITGSFTRRGHLVIFYVTEDIEKEPNVYQPVVNTIDIEVGVTKNYKTSEVDKVFIVKAEKNSICVPDEIEYLIKNVYNKYAIPSFISQRFISDYIYSAGCNPNNYDLTVEAPEKADAENTKFKSNFIGNNKAHRADKNTESKESVSSDDTHKKPNKKRKHSSKKPKTEVEAPTTEEASNVSDVAPADAVTEATPQPEVESAKTEEPQTPDSVVSKETSEE